MYSKRLVSQKVVYFFYFPQTLALKNLSGFGYVNQVAFGFETKISKISTCSFIYEKKLPIKWLKIEYSVRRIKMCSHF